MAPRVMASPAHTMRASLPPHSPRPTSRSARPARAIGDVRRSWRRTARAVEVQPLGRAISMRMDSSRPHTRTAHTRRRGHVRTAVCRLFVRDVAKHCSGFLQMVSRLSRPTAHGVPHLQALRPEPWPAIGPAVLAGRQRRARIVRAQRIRPFLRERRAQATKQQGRPNASRPSSSALACVSSWIGSHALPVTNGPSDIRRPA